MLASLLNHLPSSSLFCRSDESNKAWTPVETEETIRKYAAELVSFLASIHRTTSDPNAPYQYPLTPT